MIIMTHQPDWLVEWYENGGSRNNNLVSELICGILKERCRLRIDGDIHHYMRHSSDQLPDSKSVYAQHLLVNGCGGAFAHPTHVFRDFTQFHGVSYKRESAYPSFEISRKVRAYVYTHTYVLLQADVHFLFFRLVIILISIVQLALRNISNFRRENWQFDFIGGIIYFILVFSMFPQVNFNIYIFVYSELKQACKV